MTNVLIDVDKIIKAKKIVRGVVMRLASILTILLSSICVLPANALVIPAVPTEPIYFEPPVVTATDKHKQLSCLDLDKSIRYLHPYKYTYKPNFAQDGANKLATALIVVDNLPIVEGWFGLAYLGYSALVEEKEQRRVLAVEQQIAMLRQVKAEKHCFE